MFPQPAFKRKKNIATLLSYSDGPKHLSVTIVG